MTPSLRNSTDHMNIDTTGIDLRPTAANDFILTLDTGTRREKLLCFATENEVHRQFKRLEKGPRPHSALPRLKEIALQLVRQMRLERDPHTPMVQAAFDRIFPNGFHLDGTNGPSGAEVPLVE